MIRLLVLIAVLAALAFGFSWVADQPGTASLTFAGQRYEVSLVVALAALIGLIVGAMIVWSVLSFVLRVPTLMSLAARMRRRNKGYATLSRGIVAAGAGDAKTAARAARDAERLLGDDLLALLLSAQAAQLSGDRAAAERVYRRMSERPETRTLGLRGLHVEARRRGDEAAAHEYARRAHEFAPLPWAGQAMLEHHAMGDDWTGALAVVEANYARKAIDKPTAARQRAVLKTAIALKLADRDPTEALALAREAIKLAPDLVPASALAGRLLAAKGDLRRASRLIEAAWRVSPHPDLARAYVDVRHGDFAADRLKRAQTLSRLALDATESRLIVARAALEARDFALARRTMAELVESGRPSVRACLLMADIEETEHGPSGRMREWLARAARAPRDPAWVADGIVSETWLPASPVDGRLDAFRWETPVERLAGPADDALPPIFPEPEPAPEPRALPEPPKPMEQPAAVAPIEAPAPAEPAILAAPEPEPAASPAEPAPQATAPMAPPAPEPVIVPPSSPEPSRAAEPATADGASASTGAPAPLPPAPAAGEPDDRVLRFATAPDDPGPKPGAAPARKRGLFG